MQYKGLNKEQVDERLRKYGLNEVEVARKKSIISLFFSQLNNFFAYLLLGAGVISFVLGETLDAFLILAIVFLNALFGLYQELKADEAVEALKSLVVFKVRVIREGKEQEIDSKYLVPGDIVFLEEGVRIPADGEILETKVLEVNEAILTGESLPVSKKKGDEVFMGTLVVKGHGLLKVKKTGMSTSFGKIAEKLSYIEKGESTLEQKLKDLSYKIGILGTISAIFVLILSYFKGLNIFHSFLLAVSLAVAVIPEGLPAVMTMTLAIGVREMAKRKAIVKRLSSIETLGSVTLIATDKTGTLTENKMQVKETFFVGKKDKEEKMLLFLNSILCSTAVLVYSPGGEVDYLGDPTEGALLIFVHNHGLDISKEREEWEYLEEEPFDSAIKKMTVKVKNKKDGRIFYFSKGAPEIILRESEKVLQNGKVINLTDEIKDKIEGKLNDWTLKGYRVLAFSYGKEKPDTFLALVALYDPPRKEVKAALLEAKKAGIKTVMITGDNEKTAASLGISIGLLSKDDVVLNGEELEKYTDEELIRILPKVKAFARVSPFHKVKIVELYQKLGEVVAVTGDGVNDAIALKKANVGIAMGKIGTDVAREAADMIITDDNYATIVKAIEYGRNITLNMKNSVFYLLSCNAGEVVSLLGSLFLGIARLFTPVQILFVNLVTDGVPALAFAFSPFRKEVMERPPERELVLVSKTKIKEILKFGLLSGLIVIISVFLFGKNGLYFKRAIAFTTLVFLQTYIFAGIWLSGMKKRKEFKNRLNRVFLLSFLFPFVIQFVVITSSLTSIFKSESLMPSIVIILLLYSGIILVGFIGSSFFRQGVRENE